jgi:hypothetical protein
MTVLRRVHKRSTYTGRFEALVQHFRRLLGWSTAADNVNNLTLLIQLRLQVTSFTSTSIHITVIVWRGSRSERYWSCSRSWLCSDGGGHLKYLLCYGYEHRMQRSDKSPPHDPKSTPIAASDDWRMLQRAESSFPHLKKADKLVCYVKTKCFHFVKIDNNNNKSDINVETS